MQKMLQTKITTSSGRLVTELNLLVDRKIDISSILCSDSPSFTN